MPPPLLPELGPLALPPVIVKPSSTVSGPSPFRHCTTWKLPVPSMVVTSDPAELRSVTALPRKLMASKYVPGATTISSVSTALSMAVWIEQYGSASDPLPGPGQLPAST